MSFKEITKKEFKKIYFAHPDKEMSSKALQDDWDMFYEHEKCAKYFFEEPPSAAHTRLFVVKDYSVKNKIIYRIFFVTEESEEEFFRISSE